MTATRIGWTLAIAALVCTAGSQAAFPVVARAAEPDAGRMLTLHARIREKNQRGQIVPRQQTLRWDTRKTAVIICDMWNKHWCAGATRRVAEMAPRMNEVVAEARKRGVLIIHCPSGCMDSYKDTPQRKLAEQAPKVAAKVPLKGWCHLDKDREGDLPIDDSDGGCDCRPQCTVTHPWRRQIATIEIKSGDAITDSAEAYYLMRRRGITNVIVMGVHTNMCVLGRPFSIRQMVYQGQNVVLMRDMTDTMYNSRMPPYVSHFRGTELVTDHIEQHWCPTITSTDLTGKPAFSFSGDKRPRVAFVIGEPEYQTEESLPAFADAELAPRGVRSTFIHAAVEDPNSFPGIEAVQTADLVFLSVRRRALPKRQLDAIRRYLDAGGPLVGIRTASHAFAPRDVPEGGDRWDTFDPEVLGGNYHGHYGNKEKTAIRAAAAAGEHPILAGVDVGSLRGNGSLYKSGPLAPSATPLLIGSIPGQPAEPVAWTHTYKKSRVFYTSLGHAGDFQTPAFRRLLVNAVYWAMGKPVPNAKPSGER